MSQPVGTQPCSRNHSRNMRLIRFRAGAFPTFLVTVSPSLPARSGAERCLAIARTCRPCSFIPFDWTATKSARCRSRISFEIPDGERLRATATSSQPSPKCACGPSHDGDEELHDHRGSSCGHGSRGCACGSCCGADRYACSRCFSESGTRVASKPPGSLRRGIDTQAGSRSQGAVFAPVDPVSRARSFQLQTW